jgi:CBS domain-containing protein
MTTIASSPLAAIQAQSVMSPGLITAPPCAALSELATLMVVHQVHAVLVDPGAPRLITARDVIRAGLAGATSASEVKLPEPPSVASHETLLTVAERMVKAGEGHVIVRDDGHGRALGVLSSFDVVAVLAGHEPRTARIVRPAPARPALSPRPFAARDVRDVMHRGVISCAPTAPFADVAAVLVERRTHSAMVSREGGMAFVTDMDLVAAALRGRPLPTAQELAGTGIGIAVVTEHTTLDHAAPLVAETAAGHIVVVDSDGLPVGVVSTLDVLGAMGAD